MNNVVKKSHVGPQKQKEKKINAISDSNQDPLLFSRQQKMNLFDAWVVFLHSYGEVTYSHGWENWGPT